MGMRARIIDRLTEAVRAPREVARLRAQCERLRKKRDAAITERDARISTDIDGAQAWLVARGWWFEREDASPVSEPWSAYRDTAAEPVLVADTYWRAVLHALGEELSDAWDSAPDPEDDA